MHKFSTVKKGSTGEDVIVLQTVLSMLHYTGVDGKALTIDGEAGINTVFAINSFQSTMRGKNDSSFGKSCWTALVGDGYA